MKYKVKPAEKSTVKITINFTAEEWEGANNKAYLQNRSRYAVNGFRKGKVPRHVLELYYGKGLFYEDALNLLFQEHYPEILKKEEKKYTFVGEPTLSLGDDFSEENIVLIAVAPVKPDVVIETYKGIKIPKYEYTVTDAEVEEAINAERERYAETIEIKDRPAQLGDIANIDFVGKKDGVAFEGGSAKGQDLELGSHSFIEGFEEGVVGMNLEETKDIALTFPENYSAKDLAGQNAVFTVTLHKLSEKKLPELDEEFAKKMKCETVEEYRGKVRSRLKKSAKTRSINDTENSILNEIAKTASAEIPDAMIDRECELSLQRMEYSLMYQGIKLDDYLKYLGKTREEFKKGYEEDARKTVLRQLIIEKLIKEENIEASEEEVDQKIAEQAKSVGKEPEEYKKTMDPRQKEYIENDVKLTKLFEFLQANNEMISEETK